MIKDQPKVYICGQTRNINKRSQGRSHDNHSDYYRIPKGLTVILRDTESTKSIVKEVKYKK